MFKFSREFYFEKQIFSKTLVNKFQNSCENQSTFNSDFKKYF